MPTLFNPSIFSSLPEGSQLLFGLIFAIPLALFYRHTLKDLKPIYHHCYFIVCGTLLGYFLYGLETFYFHFSILFIYSTLYFFGPCLFSVFFTFFFTFAFLLWGYFSFSSDSYDVNWTTSYCVLVLRLIAFSWDFYDGNPKRPPSNPNSKAPTSAQSSAEDQEYHIRNLPSLIEFSGFCLSFCGLLVGPLFPYKKYEKVVTNQQISVPGSKPPTSTSLLSLPIPHSYILQRLAAFAVYLSIVLVVAPHFPPRHQLSFAYLESPFYYRFFYTMISGWCALKKYFTVWLVSETVCVICGLGFTKFEPEFVEGKNQATPKAIHDGIANVRPFLFEFGTKLKDVVASFNVNTNLWASRYLFKRLRFLGSKNLSAALTLFFLAIWHGFHPGYFFCFSFEFVSMEAERCWCEIFSHRLKTMEDFFPPARFLFVFIAFFYKMCFLSYGLIGFELLTFHDSVRVYNSFYWYAHLLCIACIVFSNVFHQKKDAAKESIKKKQ